MESLRLKEEEKKEKPYKEELFKEVPLCVENALEKRKYTITC